VVAVGQAKASVDSIGRQDSVRQPRVCTFAVSAGGSMFNRIVARAVLLAGLCSLALPAAAQLTPGKKLCWNESRRYPLDDVLFGCNALIESGLIEGLDLASYYARRGEVLLQLDEGEKALTDYDKAIALRPESPSLYWERGKVYKALGDVDRALKDYDKSLAVGATVDGFLERGSFLYEQGQRESALHDFAAAAKLEPTSPRALWSHGVALYDTGQSEAAAAALDKLIALRAKSSQDHVLRASVFLLLGQLDKSAGEFDKAIELDPNEPSVYAQRATLFLAGGEPGKALLDSTKAAALEPTRDRVNELGYTQFAAGDFKNAAVSLSTRSRKPYVTLFRYLALTRFGETATKTLVDEVADSRTVAWPRPVVEFYLGRHSAVALLSTAQTPAQRCEANFYVGEKYLLEGDVRQATEFFKSAVGICSKIYVEYGVALAELSRLRN
jgi:tetratricopeptide (TPR) repeat protein